MPINSIVAFSFSRLVAWFNKRHELALQLQSSNQLWPDKPSAHLAKAKDKAHTHEEECFDHATGKYQVTELGWNNIGWRVPAFKVLCCYID